MVILITGNALGICINLNKYFLEIHMKINNIIHKMLFLNSFLFHKMIKVDRQYMKIRRVGHTAFF